MVGHGGSSAGSYLADPTSPVPSHCASIVATSTLRFKWPSVIIRLTTALCVCGLMVVCEYSESYVLLQSCVGNLKWRTPQPEQDHPHHKITINCLPMTVRAHSLAKTKYSSFSAHTDEAGM